MICSLVTVTVIAGSSFAGGYNCETVAQDTLITAQAPPPNGVFPAQGVLRVYVHKIEGYPDSLRWTDAEIAETVDVLRADLAPFGIYVHVAGSQPVTDIYLVSEYPFLSQDTDFFNDIGQDVMVGYEAGLIEPNWPTDGLHLYFGSKDSPQGCPGEIIHAQGFAANDGAASCSVYGRDSIGAHILSHEVGHVLGLIHTHGPGDWGGDDLVADTPRDPNLRLVGCCVHEGAFNLVDEDCNYSFTAQQDSCHALDLSTFTPDPANIMSYSKLECHEYFTAGQGARMRMFLQNDPDLAGKWSPVDFVNRSADTGFDYSPTPYSAVALDYNGNGRMDLLLSSVNDAAGLMENVFNTSHPDVPFFLDRAEDEFGLGNAPVNARGIAIADFDNDDDVDLLLTSRTSPALYEHDTSAQNRFTDISSTVMYGGVFTSVTDSSWAAAWGDYDRDGHVDLYIGRAGGTTSASGGLRDVLLRNMGDGTFIEVTATVGLSAAPHLTTTGVAWIDADEDGELDLVVAGAGSSEEMLLLRQSIDVTPEYEYEHSFASDQDLILGGVTALEGVRGVSVRDLDNDGHLDLVAVSSSTGSAGSRILWGAGLSGFDSETLLGEGVAASGVSLTDLLLDGATDVLFAPSGSVQYPHVFLNARDGSPPTFHERGGFLGLGTTTPSSFQALAAADFAGPSGSPDGDVDLYLGRPSSSQAFFYQNARAGTDTPTRKWLKVKVASDDLPNNRGGIGSVVKVATTLPGSVELVQTQVVDGGSGVGTQAAHELVFGLANAVGDVEVEVTWPDGWVQQTIVSNGSLPTTVTMQENRTTVGLVAASVGAYVQMDPLDDASWIFEWETSYLSDPSQDAVRVWSGKCALSPVTLTPTSNDVTHKVFAKENGGYLHRLAWDGRTCAIGCSYKYRVESGASSTADPDTSAHKTLSISSCIN